MKRLRLLLLVSALMMISPASFGASWDCLKAAKFDGISLDKQLQPNVLEYTLSLSKAPTVTIGSQTYSVNWVQAFYVASGTPGGKFVATEGDAPRKWDWDSKSCPAQISGWVGQGNARLDPGESATFSFAEFDPGQNPVVPAYHISYQVGRCSYTDWFKAEQKNPMPNVPEPGSMLCLGVGVAGLFFVARQRRSARVR